MLTRFLRLLPSLALVCSLPATGMAAEAGSLQSLSGSTPQTMSCREPSTVDAGLVVEVEARPSRDSKQLAWSHTALYELQFAGPQRLAQFGCQEADRTVEEVDLNGFRVAYACALEATWDMGYGIVLKENADRGHWQASVYEFHISGLIHLADLVCDQ